MSISSFFIPLELIKKIRNESCLFGIIIISCNEAIGVDCIAVECGMDCAVVSKISHQELSKATINEGGEGS